MELEVLLIALVIVAAVASRPVEVRLWQAWRLSDRAYVALLLSRFPLVVGVALIIFGAPFAATIGLTAITALPGLLMYPFVLHTVREQHEPNWPN